MNVRSSTPADRTSRERLLRIRTGLRDLVDGDIQTIERVIDALCMMFELPRYEHLTLRSVVEVLQVKPPPMEFLEEGLIAEARRGAIPAEERCGAHDERNIHVCSLRRGHEGDHICLCRPSDYATWAKHTGSPELSRRERGVPDAAPEDRSKPAPGYGVKLQHGSWYWHPPAHPDGEGTVALYPAFDEKGAIDLTWNHYDTERRDV